MTQIDPPQFYTLNRVEYQFKNSTGGDIGNGSLVQS